MKNIRKFPRGYTLTEMVIVIAIMAIIAAVAVPELSKNDESKLDAAAAEVASAMRFAHSEAVRTGEPYGVYASHSDQRIRVYRLPVSTPIYDVYDPLTKQLMDFQFNNNTNEVELDSVVLTFHGMWGWKSYLGFEGGSGTPKYNDSGTTRMLNTGYVRLSYGDAKRTINISPMTGRVTVQ